MLFDTDVLIWIQRGNEAAAKMFQSALDRYLSVQSYMELLQCAPSKKHLKIMKDFLREFEVQLLPFNENIGHRAAIYIEEYSLASGIRAGDAVIAATAIEFDQILVTANAKHFKPIATLHLKILHPHK